MINNKFYYGIIREDGFKKEGMTMTEVERRFRVKLNLEVGKAYFMGKVEALLDEGYGVQEIAEKLHKPESTIRIYKKRIDKKRAKN